MKLVARHVDGKPTAQRALVRFVGGAPLVAVVRSASPLIVSHVGHAGRSMMIKSVQPYHVLRLPHRACVLANSSSRALDMWCDVSHHPVVGSRAGCNFDGPRE